MKSTQRTGRFSINHFRNMRYVCEKCGEEKTFDGAAVKIRTHAKGRYAGDGNCFGDMHLQNRDEYWNGEREPDEVINFA